MQSLVFSLAILRFYLLGMLELNSYINSISGAESQMSILMSVFSYLLFGQILDNQPQSRQKTIYCTLELIMGLWFMIVGYSTFWSYSSHYLLTPMSIFLSCAFTIMTALQLFNWFSKQYLGTILGLWLSATSLGMMTKFLLLHIYYYFPSM